MKDNNQQFLCVTDHGAQGAVPSQIRECEKQGISPLFGIELYESPWQVSLPTDEDRKKHMDSLNEEEKLRLRKSFHMLAIAFNEEGYKNLVRLSSWGYLHGMGGRPTRPRVNHEQLLAHKEGIIFSSCCYASRIGYTFDTQGEDAAMDMLRHYVEMFGENYRLEIMMLDFAKQKPYDQFILKAHDILGIPVFISQDAHASCKENIKHQRLQLMVQTKTDLETVTRLDAEGADLFVMSDPETYTKSESELNAYWASTEYKDIIDYDLFKQAKRETVNIARKCKGVTLDRTNKLPQIPDAKEKLIEAAFQGFKRRNLPQTLVYQKRLHEELELIIRKGFDSYFLIQKMMTDEARRICPTILGFGDGSEAVGVGRGSGVASLVFYCLGVTDVDPVKHGLIFSRFLSEARGGRTMKLRFTNIDPISEDDLEV